MRLRKAALVLICAVLVVAFLPASAFASHCVSKSTGADAWYSSWDYENGDPGPADATTEWNVSGSTGTSSFGDAGIPTDVMKGSTGWVSVFSYTPASGSTPATWEMLDLFSEAPGLVFGKKLAGASMSFVAEGTMNVWTGSSPWIQTGPDEWEMRDPDSSSTEMVSVLGEWKAAGLLTKSSWSSRESSDGFIWADRNTGTNRAASAKILVVGAGGTVYIDQTAADAQLNDQHSIGKMRGDFPY